MSNTAEKESSGSDKLDKEYSVAKQDGRPYYYFPPSQRKVHDSDVTFEEYHFFAKKTRAEQKNLQSPKLQWRQWLDKKGGKVEFEEKHEIEPGMTISDEEWNNASRALRTAGWGAVFYLVAFGLLTSFERSN